VISYRNPASVDCWFQWTVRTASGW